MPSAGLWQSNHRLRDDNPLKTVPANFNSFTDDFFGSFARVYLTILIINVSRACMYLHRMRIFKQKSVASVAHSKAETKHQGTI
jgi:hypothetical protein